MTSYDTIPPKPIRGILGIALAAGLTLSGIKYSIDRSNGYRNGENKITFGETPKAAVGLEGKLDSANIQTSELPYASFRERYPNEIDDVLVQSTRYDIDPVLLMAVRCAENGRDALAYGIKPHGKQKERYEKDSGYEMDGKFYAYPKGDAGKRLKQMCWAAKSLHERTEEYKENKNNGDLIDYIQPIWAPGSGSATNDPRGRNAHWEDNVRHWYDVLNAERPKK